MHGSKFSMCNGSRNKVVASGKLLGNFVEEKKNGRFSRKKEQIFEVKIKETLAKNDEIKEEANGTWRSVFQMKNNSQASKKGMHLDGRGSRGREINFEPTFQKNAIAITR